MSTPLVTYVVISDVLREIIGQGWDTRDVKTIVDKLTDPDDSSMDYIITTGVIADGRPRYHRHVPQFTYTASDGEAAVDCLIAKLPQYLTGTYAWLKIVLTRLFIRPNYSAAGYDGIYIESMDRAIVFLRNAAPDDRSILYLDLGEIITYSARKIPQMLRDAQFARISRG
jgi:hypothetical protein